MDPLPPSRLARSSWPAQAGPPRPIPTPPAAWLERFAGLGAAEARLLRDPAFAAMLRALGGNSPYLSDLAVRESAALRRLWREGPDAVAAAALRDVARSPAGADRAALAATLRQAKRRVALATALADIGGAWPLQQVTATLSALAEAALDASVGFGLRAAERRGALRLPRGRRMLAECGLVVLGMGKLGARELNYSSDIDLVLIYDPDRHPGAQRARRGVHPRHAGCVHPYGGAGRRRLRFPHRSAAAAGPGRHAARDQPAGGARLLREHGGELGARGHDQGAPGGRRPGAGRAVPARDPPVRLAPAPGFRRGGGHPRHEAPHGRAPRHRARQRVRPGAAGRRARREAGPGRHPRRGVRDADDAAGLGRPQPRPARPDHRRGAGGAGRGRAPGRGRGARAARRLPLPAPGRAPAADGGGPADPHACRPTRPGWSGSPASWASPTARLRDRAARPPGHASASTTRHCSRRPSRSSRPASAPTPCARWASPNRSGCRRR